MIAEMVRDMGQDFINMMVLWTTGTGMVAGIIACLIWLFRRELDSWRRD